jgi:hypothetical protein
MIQIEEEEDGFEAGPKVAKADTSLSVALENRIIVGAETLEDIRFAALQADDLSILASNKRKH